MDIIGIFVLLLGLATCVVCSEYPPHYPLQRDQKKSFACENSYIHLSCKDSGEHIRILRANYGRFSLVVCNERGVNKGWNTQCGAESSIGIVTEKCEGRNKCTFRVNSEVFGDPCPETFKYIEVQYFCEKGHEKTTTDAPTTVSEPPTTEKPPITTTGQPKVTTTASSSWPNVSTTKVVPEPTTTVETTTKHKHEHKNKTSTDKQTDERVCQTMEKAGIVWEETQPGETRTTKCPEAMTGEAEWMCGKNGKWRGQPDLTNCVSLWMSDIHDMMDSNALAETVVTMLSDKMTAHHLGSGDLKEASNTVIPGLVKKMKEQVRTEMPSEEKKAKIQAFTKNLMKTGSGLLNETQRDSWNYLLPEQRKKAATSLIVSLEQMALEVAATIDKPETVTSTEQNIVMEVSVIKMSRSQYDLNLPIMQYEHGPADGYHDFTLPLDAVSGISSQDDVTVTYLFYNNLQSLMNPLNDEPYTNPTNTGRTINSNIISASISKHSTESSNTHEITQLSRPMTFTLSHKTSLKDKVAVCVYWKYDASSLIGEWSQDGCSVVESNDEFTTCQCDHLTNFAVLMDVSGTKLERIHHMSLQAITYVGCTVSIFCLIMCFISFTIFRNLQSDRNTIHKNLVLCLMIAELLFLFGIGQTQDQVLCSVIAGFLHFFFLTSFSWMCLEGIQLYFMLIEVFEAERSRVRWFYLFGYGVPALIVGISAAIDHTGYGTENHCWLKTDNYFVLSFVIPVAVVVMINVVMLSIAIYMMCRHAGVTASSIQARKKGKLEKLGNGHSHDNSIVSDTSSTHVEMPIWLKGSAVLVVLLGLTWTFGFLYINKDLLAIAYIFTILNSLQGLFIFIFHCFMDKKVKKEWRRAIYKCKWLPVCCRVNLGGYNGNLSSPTPSSSSGQQNYFMRFWSSRKRKRSTTSTGTCKNRRSDLDSFLRSDVSSGNTVGTGVNRYSNQSEKLLNGQNVYTAMPTHFEGGIVGDLSVMEGSVIDSEYVSEYCQNNLQVSQEKKQYSSGSDDSDDECQKDNVSHDSISKNRLSFLSTDSNLKLQSDFGPSDNEGSKISVSAIEEGKGSKIVDNVKSDSDRNLLNDLLSMYQNSNSTAVNVTDERISSLQNILDSKTEPEQNTENHKSITKSAPDLKYPSHVYTNQGMETSSSPLLGSLPDLSTIREEEGESDLCSKSANFESKA